MVLQADLPFGRACESVGRSPCSRLPLYGADRDQVTGFVLREDILFAHLQGRDETPVSALRRDLLSVPAVGELGRLMDALLERRQHIALVVGEIGETGGVVTL